MFSNNEINFELLKARAFNLRWASVEEGVIPLTAADPDFMCAPAIADALQKYVKDRYFSYAPAEGYGFFKEAVANFHTEKRNMKMNPEWVLPVDSAAYGIYAVCRTFLEKGDEAIVFNPVDFLFAYSVESVGATAIRMPVPFNPSEEIDYDLLRELISPKTKLICLCNPLNPTGKVFTKDELLKIGQLAIEHNLIILSDEIWSDIVFNPSSYISMAAINTEIAERTIVVTGYSKSYGLAGLRVGSILAPSDGLFQKLLVGSNHQATIAGCNVLAQVAATAALNESAEWLVSFIEHLTRMRDLLVSGLNSLPGFHCHLPQGCYLAFPDITGTTYSAQELQIMLLDKAKVAVVPGLPQWFGERAQGHIRLSFATSEELIKEALYRMSTVIK